MARKGPLWEKHLNELLPYGGLLVSRREIIRDLKASGADDGCVDRYLQGLERRVRVEAMWARSSRKLQ